MQVANQKGDDVLMEKECCVRCGQETPYDIQTPVTQRLYYIEGSGQLCPNCYRILYGEAKRDEREQALSDLHANPGSSLYLWKAVIAFEGQEFTTSGRGSREGVRFTYSITRTAGQKGGGHRYNGEAVEGYGNELWVITDGEEKKKSISRSTVELGYKRAVEAGGIVTGPKKLNVPGAGSYLYPMFIRFGVINNNSSVE